MKFEEVFRENRIARLQSLHKDCLDKQKVKDFLNWCEEKSENGLSEEYKQKKKELGL